MEFTKEELELIIKSLMDQPAKYSFELLLKIKLFLDANREQLEATE